MVKYDPKRESEKAFRKRRHVRQDMYGSIKFVKYNTWIRILPYRRIYGRSENGRFNRFEDLGDKESNKRSRAKRR